MAAMLAFISVMRARCCAAVLPAGQRRLVGVDADEPCAGCRRYPQARATATAAGINHALGRALRAACG
jgi:hypothetical protein